MFPEMHSMALLCFQAVAQCVNVPVYMYDLRRSLVSRILALESLCPILTTLGFPIFAITTSQGFTITPCSFAGGPCVSVVCSLTPASDPLKSRASARDAQWVFFWSDLSSVSWLKVSLRNASRVRSCLPSTSQISLWAIAAS